MSTSDSYIIAIALIIALVILLLSLFLIGATARTLLPRKRSGTDSIGTWKLVGTSYKALKSYIFTDKTLTNSDGKSLVVVLNQLFLIPFPEINQNSEISIWTFDGNFLFTNGIYLSYDFKNQRAFLSGFPQTSFLFDGYNFYLTNNLFPPKAYVLDPISLKILQTSSDNLYQDITPKWTITAA